MKVTPSKIDALMPFLKKFEECGFADGTPRTDATIFPDIKFEDTVNRFTRALYQNDWIASDFNWTKWQETAQRYVECRDMVGSADTLTIQKLLTTHVRKDRFCEGHLASMIKNGHILGLLRRLQELRLEMNQEVDDEFD